jgi:hypothetical protein
MLRCSKFTQVKDPTLIVNVPILVQACLFYEQILDRIGLSKNSEMDIRLDSRSIQNIVTYSRLNPPYDQYEEFKHSHIKVDAKERSNTRYDKSRLDFSGDYHRYITD